MDAPLKTWRYFLKEHGAVEQPSELLHFSPLEEEIRAAQQDLVIADLSHLGLLQALGNEAASFLQNQLTNDIGLVNLSHSQLSGYCEPKGRLLALFQIIKSTDGYLLQLPRDLLPASLARLRRYILRSKLTLDESPLVCFGIAGSQAETILSKLTTHIPRAINEVCHTQTYYIVRVAGPSPRFQLIGDNASLQPLWLALTAYATPVSSKVWRWLDIQAGLPSLYPETVEIFIPQMLNMDVLQGVSFKKGCYPGQEIVARTQHLGRIKQRMIRSQVMAQACPQPGDLLYAPDARGQSVGTVVDAQPAASHGYDLLATVQLSSRERGEIYLDNGQTAALKLLDLPYALPVSA